MSTLFPCQSLMDEKMDLMALVEKLWRVVLNYLEILAGSLNKNGGKKGAKMLKSWVLFNFIILCDSLPNSRLVNRLWGFCFSLNATVKVLSTYLQVSQGNVPGVESASLAMDTEEGVEVVWNEVLFSDKKVFKAQEVLLVLWHWAIYQLVIRAPYQVFLFLKKAFLLKRKQ